MSNEPIPGVVPEEVVYTDAEALYNQYFPVVLDSKAGGLSSLEQEEFKKMLTAIITSNPEWVGSERIKYVKNLVQAVVKDLQERPLSAQIADFIEKYEGDPYIKGAQIYCAGSLITDKLYPDEEKGYRELDTKESITATREQKRSGLFVKVWRTEKGKIDIRPILEKEPIWGGRNYNWNALIELPKYFFSGASTVAHLDHKGRPLYERKGKKEEDFLLPTHLLRGWFDVVDRKLNPRGNWDTQVEINAKTLSVRNLERWVRAYAGCLGFQITREK